MAWNEPDNDDRKDDAWSNRPRNGKDQGPPDLDEVIGSLVKKFSGLFGGRGNKGFSGGSDDGEGNGLTNGMVMGVIVLAAIIWVAAGFYTVNEQERGVILRFGRALDSVVNPGLHWNPPLIDQVTKINVTRVYDIDITGDMLTEDDNIVDLNMSVQYIVTSARDYFLNVRDPDISLQEAAESAIRHVVGSTEMTTALTLGRDLMAQETQARLQTYMNNYGTGITVSQVNIDRSQPPGEVRDAFDDVIKADEDNRSYQNQARAYASQVVPEARGQAQRILENALAYREQLIARASGDARRFDLLLTEYQKAPEVTRNRLYLDTMEEVMANSTKVLIDVEGGNNMMYLPLDRIMEQRQAPNVSGNISSSNVTNQEIRTIADQVIRDIQSRQTTTTRAGGR
ncbi:MAG: FtsH protease activity modulator HflK [Pseudohongiellaceae bacterium]